MLLVVLVLVVAAYVTWTAGRIDRLHDRCAAARSALDAQLVRRAATAAALAHDRADELGSAAGKLHGTATQALDSEERFREATENDLTRSLRELPWPVGATEIAEVSLASRRMAIARHIYNDAVRDTRGLSGRRLPRLLRLGSGRELPLYFDIDDSPPGFPLTPS